MLLGLAVAQGPGRHRPDVDERAALRALESAAEVGNVGLFGAIWSDPDLEDKAGKVQTDLDLLMAVSGVRQ